MLVRASLLSESQEEHNLDMVNDMQTKEMICNYFTDEKRVET